MAREPLHAMVRTRPLDPSKVAINISKSSKTTRPVDSPAAASTSRDSDEVWRLSLGHLVTNYKYHFIDNPLLQRPKQNILIFLVKTQIPSSDWEGIRSTSFEEAKGNFFVQQRIGREFCRSSWTFIMKEIRTVSPSMIQYLRLPNIKPPQCQYECDLTQEYLLQPELLPGWASNESILGV